MYDSPYEPSITLIPLHPGTGEQLPEMYHQIEMFIANDLNEENLERDIDRALENVFNELCDDGLEGFDLSEIEADDLEYHLSFSDFGIFTDDVQNLTTNGLSGQTKFWKSNIDTIALGLCKYGHIYEAAYKQSFLSGYDPAPIDEWTVYETKTDFDSACVDGYLESMGVPNMPLSFLNEPEIAKHWQVSQSTCTDNKNFWAFTN